MKKFRDYSIYTKISLCVFITAVAVLIVARLLDGADDLWALIKSWLKTGYRIFYPFILGAAIAYLLTPAVRAICKLLRRFFPKLKEGAANGIAVTLLYLGMAGLLSFFVAVFVPDLVSNLIDFSKNANSYYIQISEFVENEIFSDPLAVQIGLRDLVHRNIFAMSESIKTNLSGIVGNVMTLLLRVFLTVTDATLGILLSVYMLLARRSLSRFFKNFFASLLGPKRKERFLAFMVEVDILFGKYISARLLESLIISVVTTVAFLIAGVRYNALLGFLAGAMNLIPYIGGAISGTLAVLLTVLDSPQKAMVVLIILLVVQTLDNVVLAPKLYGKSLGLNAFWALAAVLLGGAAFGPLGMVLGVPFMRIAQIFYIGLAKRLEARRAKAGN